MDNQNLETTLLDRGGGESSGVTTPEELLGYDYCMVFDYDSKTQNGLSEFAKRYLKKLEGNGLELFLYYGVGNRHIFVLIKASLKNLRLFADANEFVMMLDPSKLREYANAGDAEIGISPIEILDDKTECEYNPYELIYGKYRTEIPE
jgi:hypothetical protein